MSRLYGGADTGRYTKLIAFGVAPEEKIAPEDINAVNYTQKDIVRYLVSGGKTAFLDARKVKEVLDIAIQANATIIGKNAFNRTRSHNVGERIIAYYLKQHGYIELNRSGTWVPR